MNAFVAAMKNHVRMAAENPTFRHSRWYVKYHLEILERIALELCDHYPAADRSLVVLFVWLHDYGKICNFADANRATLTEGRRLLLDCGFEAIFIEQVLHDMEVFDRKDPAELQQARIEVQIVSSADAAAHLASPFFAIYWWENPGFSLEEVIASNRAKALKDWTRKITLPEVREAFAARHQYVLETLGELPERFFS